MQTDTTGITATELHGEDRQQVVATALAGELTLAPKEENERQRVVRVLGPMTHAEHRALQDERNSRVTNNLGLWG